VQGPFIERQPVTVVFSNPFDPSAADRDAGFTYSYDLDGDGVFEIAKSTSPTAQFTPPSEGVFTVRGRIIDKDGGFSEYTATTPGSSGVAISNVDIFAAGTGTGGSPLVKVYNPNGTFKGSFFAYDPGFRGGVTVAVGDITGDGIPDIVTGTGPGGGPDVRIFDGTTFRNIGGFLVYEQTYRGGVNVAVGDVDGDGQLDIVTGTGDGGGPIVGVFGADGTLKHRFATFDPDFRGGVNVAAGDINGDGHADIIAGAGDTGAPRVQVFSGANPSTILSSFFAYDSSFRGGVFVSAGDVDGDGQVEIITGTGRTGGPHLKVFDPSGTVEQSVFIFGPDRTTGLPLRNGFYVSAHTDLDGDAVPDILAAAGPEFAPVVHGAKGTTMEELLNFIAYEDDFTGGVYIG
jgi:hypothetical protein